jgi:two-component system nitrate/nitrite sensor histidine kinase NarX
LGELCVARGEGGPFTEPERSLLGALAEMAAIAVSTARLREAERQWLVLSERDRIARELHDSIAQVLGVLHLRLRAIPAAPSGEAGARMAREIEDLATIADEAYRDVREAILGLRETVHSETGLAGALSEYLGKYGRQNGIAARLLVEDPAATHFAPQVEIQLLRVVQEALTNVRKHAQASIVVVRLAREGDATVVTIEDDGVGFDAGGLARSFGGGFGMTTMRERVEQVGGTLDVHTAAGVGTRVVVRLGAEGSRGTPTAALADRAGR